MGKLLRILSIIALLSGMVSCVAFFIGFKQAPNLWFDLEKTTKDGLSKYLIFGPDNGHEFEETKIEEIKDLQEVDFIIEGADIEIVGYQGAELEVTYRGLATEAPSQSLIGTKKTGDKLEIRLDEPPASYFFSWSINGEEQNWNSKEVFVKVMVPDSYKGKIRVHSKRGDIMYFENSSTGQSFIAERGDINISLEGQRLYEFDLKSDQGEIINESGQGADNRVDPQSVGSIHAETRTGDITISLSSVDEN